MRLQPIKVVTSQPTPSPTALPSAQPTALPTAQPTAQPTGTPSREDNRCMGVMCSGRGKCTDTKVGNCVCDPGWFTPAAKLADLGAHCSEVPVRIVAVGTAHGCQSAEALRLISSTRVEGIELRLQGSQTLACESNRTNWTWQSYVTVELSQDITPSGRVECALDSSNTQLVRLERPGVMFAATAPNDWKIAVEAVGQKDVALAGSRASVNISVQCSSSDRRFQTSRESVQLDYERIPLPIVSKMKPSTISMVGGTMLTIQGKNLPHSPTVHVDGVEVSGGFVVRAVLVNHSSEELLILKPKFVQVKDDGGLKTQDSSLVSWMQSACDRSALFFEELDRKSHPTLADDPTDMGTGSAAALNGKDPGPSLNTTQMGQAEIKALRKAPAGWVIDYPEIQCEGMICMVKKPSNVSVFYATDTYANATAADGRNATETVFDLPTAPEVVAKAFPGPLRQRVILAMATLKVGNESYLVVM